MTRHHSTPAPNLGFSLVELLVAMTIGLAVIGVAASAYLNVVTNSKNATALGQMTEDANAALTILRSQLVLAGYSRPLNINQVIDTSTGVPITVVAVDPVYVPNPALGAVNVFGCDTNFSAPESHQVNIGKLACNAPTAVPPNADSNAIAVVYEANTDNTYPSAAGIPTDCLGNALVQRTDAIDSYTNKAVPYYLASNKFFVAIGASGNKELYCLGNSGTLPTNETIASTKQPIVENIVNLQIRYGVTNPSLPAPSKLLPPAPQPSIKTPISRDAVTYVSASHLSADNWARVVSARVCVEVASAEDVPVADRHRPYIDCNDALVPAASITDARLHRSFTTTVVLHNRVGVI